MSTPSLVNACPVCGAEESLDALLLRMIDDDTVRRLIADVLTKSLPLGGLLLRYLRLHKPEKQRLRMSTLEKLLAELVPDMQRTAIQRDGRTWLVSNDSWKAAFQAVFDGVDKGTLKLPLQGNGYLYGVLARMADRQAAAAEQERDQTLRTQPRQAGGGKSLDQLVADGLSREAVGHQVGRRAEAATAPDPEAAARAEAIKARLRADLQKRTRPAPEADLQSDSFSAKRATDSTEERKST